ncbi:MAG: histidine kinase dimerization/phospho-acceptor domain-containing protein [Desulfobacterales bacterium]|jgi:signal transduction histidine kinase|nr:histidine kinase dimerization/phospho-acceptor domain-containing protein [Desulfobacterales bacterium]
MNNSLNIAGDAGLRFFGRISASISHELRNALSIINESAGLLEDLTFMAQKGTPIDSTRLQTTAKRIQQQVGRADEIIKNMNNFSHSIDRPLSTVDVYELLAHLTVLTRRLTDMKGVQVLCESATAPIMVTTAPFFLQTLLWHLIDFAVSVLGDSKAVMLSVTKDQQNVTIYLKQLNALIPEQVKGFPGDAETALTGKLGAEVTMAPGCIRLKLPQGSAY